MKKIVNVAAAKQPSFDERTLLSKEGSLDKQPTPVKKDGKERVQKL